MLDNKVELEMMAKHNHLYTKGLITNGEYLGMVSDTIRSYERKVPEDTILQDTQQYQELLSKVLW